MPSLTENTGGDYFNSRKVKFTLQLTKQETDADEH